MSLSNPLYRKAAQSNFFRRAQAVSGSMHLLEWGGYLLLLDCGLARGPREDSRQRNWMAKGLLPRLPIYVDSPLAQKIDKVFQQYKDSLLPEIEEIPSEWLESEKDAWRRSTQREQCIIVASGGMCEGGRIVQHLKHHIDDPRSTIVLVIAIEPHVTTRDAVILNANRLVPLIFTAQLLGR